MERRRMAGWNAWRGPAGIVYDDQLPALRANDAGTYGRIWRAAARALGAEVDDIGGGFLLIRRDGAETLVQRNLTMIDHPASLALALDKSVMHALLRAHGVPVPDQLEAHRRDIATAVERLRAEGGRWVAKPASNTGGGYGVTCGVETVDDLFRAWVWASVWNERIVLQRQTEGAEYRLLFLDGEFVDAVRRRAPVVHGDGRSTVGELIEAENRRRVGAGAAEVGRAIKTDLDCVLAVRRAGFTLRSVPPAGTAVTVKGSVGDNAAADNTTAAEVAPAIVESARQAAGLARLRFAGVDVIAPDPGAPSPAAGGVVLELGGTPGLQYHYLVRDPEHATPVAEVVLERLLSEATAASGRSVPGRAVGAPG
jgi:cyanophycin synthetase